MNTLLSFVTWDVDPAFISVGSFEIRWYGVTWALAILTGMLFFMNFVRREGIDAKVADSIFWYGTLATIIGARLGHCFFYDPGYYLSHPIEILNIRQGGVASHGAAIGLLLGLWLFSRKNKLPYVWSLDRIMIVVTIGGAMVRLGNLMNSEIYGTETSLPWGFIFVRDNQTLPMHPTQIYEALSYLVTFVILWFLYYKKDMARRRPGLLFGIGLIGVFFTRFLIEFVKNPQESFEESMALHMGHWLSIPFIVLGIAMIIWSFRKPEVTGIKPPVMKGQAKKSKQGAKKKR